MQNRRPKIKHLPTTPLIIVAVFLWVFGLPDVAPAFDFHAESAHGNLAYGVDRSGATCENWPGEECVTGSCAHCHDTFDPDICESDVNGLMLFAPNNPDSQTDNFCFECHQSEDTVQQVTNYDYGATFGGGIANSTNIKDAFDFGLPNQASTTGSSHNLKKLRNWTKGRSFAPWVTADTNACVICHNPHVAQKNNNSLYDPTKSAMSLTNDHGTVWGDDSTEKMDIYTYKYQAPLWSGGTSFEPADDSTQDGSNLPDFVTFCDNKCHSKSISSAKTDVGRDLKVVNWGTDGDQHGSWHQPGHRDGKLGELRAPYTDDGDYALSCTDCHEPHGSPNAFLLRTSVNGKDNIELTPNFFEFCDACHVVYTGPMQHIPEGDCMMCHYHSCWFNAEPTF